MTPDPLEQRPWSWPYPQSWTQVYRDIAALLLGFLALAYLLDSLRTVLAQ